jgi:hypothetical protein
MILADDNFATLLLQLYYRCCARRKSCLGQPTEIRSRQPAHQQCVSLLNLGCLLSACKVQQTPLTLCEHQPGHGCFVWIDLRSSLQSSQCNSSFELQSNLRCDFGFRHGC